MNCKAVSSLLSEYLSEELSPHRSRAVEDHLKHCPECRRELASLERALHDLQRPLTLMQAPDVLDAVKARVQSQKKNRLRPMVAWGLAGVGALVLLVCWIFARPLAPVTNQDSSAMTADVQVKDHRQSPEPELSAAGEAPTPAAVPDLNVELLNPPKKVVRAQRQARHQTQAPVKQPEQMPDAVAGAGQVQETTEVEPEQPEVAVSNQDSPRSMYPAPGGLCYECVNGQGYVYRELPPGPDWSPRAHADVMVVPDADRPDPRYLIERDNLDRLASATFIARTQEGAM